MTIHSTFPDLSRFPITRRWPASDPTVLQLYSLATPNGVKVSIALEELGIAYEAHRVTLAPEDVKSPEFLSLNPNNKIPAILDPDGPDGTPITLFESGAILIYLAEKSGKLLGKSASQKYEVLKWLMFQMGGIGPMFGQLGYFHRYAGSEIEDPRPRERYIAEAKRLLNVLDTQLADRDWIAGDYSIADIAIGPWLEGLNRVYKVGDLVGMADFKHVTAYLDRFNARPAVQRGWAVPANPDA
ncbi:glutathione S-transferase N-terminal domain-containing protein [Fluviibacterium sp. DFM31]|uniref:Glutathione S-transferase N-terminal domain-containing protein n=1 Tax=Meridianimarinicoccus marinus TaxID=3231483 RepID=A0ABV3L698_9RHOB